MTGDLFSAPAVRVARVALPVPADRLFDYSIPDALASSVAVGCRVRVQVERRPLVGLVVELAEEPQEEARGRLRAIESVLDERPALPDPLLEAVLDEAHAVLCPVGIALQTALPAGASPRSSPGLALSPRGEEALRRGALPTRVARRVEPLADGPRPRRELERSPEDGTALAELVRDGLLREVRIEQGPRARIPERRVARAADGPADALEALGRAPRQAALLERMRREGAIDTRQLSSAERTALRALAKRGLATIVREERALLPAGLESTEPRPELTGEQSAACTAIGSAIEAGEPERFLLHGITGSGKTEVYLRCIERALARSRTALVLVPEITLTHQIVGRLRGRFGDTLAVLHSGLRPGERLQQWERLRRGEIPIAVGARSALFAPLRDVGVIVIDEEHDGAYKNDDGFRYHARSLAARRAKAEGCPLVLGSATPALETRYAAERGAARRLVLAHRIGGRPLPAVQIVDLQKERAALPRGRRLILSRPLVTAMADTLAEDGQSLLFLNRRGFSTQITCFACGHVERCGQCDIALVFHADAERLRCHYCGDERVPRDLCPSCGADENALLGIGTQRLEEEVRSHFPRARVARLDRDVAMRRGATEGLLGALRDREIDIVVGTQMLAKGHDFPGVRLVGVVHADLGLHFPDFRAAERTFQLLTQVAGRAGRGGAPGLVVVQTYAPDHYAIQPVLEHDYERFFREEIRQRASLGYPPFGFLANVVVSSEDEAQSRMAIENLAVVASGDGELEVLGPAPAALSKLRGRFRHQLLLKAKSRAVLHRAAARVIEASATLGRDLRTRVDPNPYDML